jgi:hypothetical protein
MRAASVAGAAQGKEGALLAGAEAAVLAKSRKRFAAEGVFGQVAASVATVRSRRFIHAARGLGIGTRANLRFPSPYVPHPHYVSAAPLISVESLEVSRV